jgi:L-ornithine N5-monooxygenase
MRSYNVKRVDALAIGFGPSNIALAIANEEAGHPLTLSFVEQASGPGWQREMLLGGSDIQNNPLRDLVTPRNPKSHYTFVNYLSCSGRLFEFLNLGLPYPLRKDYACYVEWVARFFDSVVSYGTTATRIGVDESENCWIVETNHGAVYARALILGTGRSRNIPGAAKEAIGPRVFHLNEYLSRIAKLDPQPSRIAVLGASQSAVEINLDLLRRFPECDVHAIHRSFSFRQKDTSPFSDYVYFPKFIDYYCSAGETGRASLQAQLRGTNYSAADKDVLQQLIVAMYEARLDGKTRMHIHNNTVIEKVVASANEVRLCLRERFLNEARVLNVDALVLATGFLDLGNGEGKEPYPPILSDVAPWLARRADGALDVLRDYRVENEFGLGLYLNGLCESSHGLGDAGSFSLLSMRSSEILASLCRRLGKSKDATKEAADITVKAYARIG